MNVHLDSWLAGLFGYPVYRIECEAPQASGDEWPVRVAEMVRGHSAEQPQPAFYYAKVSTYQVRLVRALAAGGLYVVAVNVIFEMDSQDAFASGASPGPSVWEIQPEYYEEVLDIAESCFQYSRFHLDPVIPVTIANRIKREWVVSYLKGIRGDKLLVAIADGHTAGFLAALTSESGGRKIATVDLIGVAERFQNQGLGRTLLGSCMAQYRHVCDRFRVSTQACNLPSLRLYEQVGFRIRETAYVMHMHVPGRVQAACQ